MEESTVEAEVLWTPSAEMVESSRLTRYMRWLAERRDLHFEDYGELPTGSTIRSWPSA
jgi:hypothetical protein